ncbi:hypothetical protein IPM44_01355 [bacterium]|nr:MAG: hypothetical protein IPM44_01355 [bacterium]
MPEPHNPEHASDSQRDFKPSVPDLRPNLGEYQTIGTGNPDRGLATHFENNEVGEEADSLRRDHRGFNTMRETHQENARDSRERFGDAHNAIWELKFAFDDTDPENLMDRAVLLEAQKILEKRRDESGEWIHSEERKADTAELGYHRNDIEARNHYYTNEEAYKNQAVNDYRRAQATNPERYPEDLNYPGYTDQAPSPERS